MDYIINASVVTQMNMELNVTYDNHDYLISHGLVKQIGFLSGMIESGMMDNLELPLPANPQVAKMGHKLLEYLASNPDTGMNYLYAGVLGFSSAKEYVAQIMGIPRIGLEQIRANLEQVFLLLALADYWDCQGLTQDCTELVTHHLSIADPSSVCEWFTGII